MIDRILMQCERVGYHTVWMGSLSEKTPVTRIPGFRQVMAVRRLVLLERGPVQPHTVAVGCGHPQCVDPSHVRAGTRKTLARVTARTNDYAQNPVRNARIAAKSRRLFTPEQALQILADPRPQRAIAKEWGCSQTTIGEIKLHRSYKYGVGNPFSGLGAR